MGGYEATWCLSGHAIRILRVRTETGTPLASGGTASELDLADMRDRFPELTPLWDAVRHQFWSQTRAEADR